MSRRRVSVKDLGVLDCQGWLQRRKEGRSFLGSKWKRYWFVLKKSSLYWYSDMMAEKAEGFINLSGFTIQQAKQCRKKHAMTASHALVVTIFMAAESFTEMNKWISKLSAAAESCDVINTEECYSEGSDQDDEDNESTSCRPTCEPQPADSAHGEALQSVSSPCSSIPPAVLISESRRRSTSEGTLSRNRRRRRRGDSGGNERLSWLDLPKLDEAGGGASLPLLHVEEAEEKVVQEKPADEMEHLYNHLKAASLSPTGRCSQRDFRASFIRRCQNDKVNEKLHLVRILNSTLKAKESELQLVNQILDDSTLTAPTYRTWKLSNLILLEEINHRNQAAGGAAELQLPEQLRADCEAQTSDRVSTEDDKLNKLLLHSDV